MNHWACWLADIAPTLQHAIARAQRISLPRGCDQATRALRLRQALCHGRTVRATFLSLPSDLQTTLWALRDSLRGLTRSELFQRYGPVRSAHELRADPVPRTMSERLLLLGWLLPRPTTPRHPERWLLPPELRRWLPMPLCLADGGVAPPPPIAPAVRATLAVLSAAAELPLPVHADARPTADALRRLAPRLTPLTATESALLLAWLVPLLTELRLLLPHGTTVIPAPAARAFLNQSLDLQLHRLTRAWLQSAHPDRLLRRALCSDGGLLWPALRRRLLAWATALPTGRLLRATDLFPALTAAFGPLADATTHGLRVVRRTPWGHARAEQVWEQALRGPLTWLGVVAWSGAGESAHCFTTGRGGADDAELIDQDDSASDLALWHYQPDGQIRVPIAGAGAELLALPAFARWERADADSFVFRLDAQSLARAYGREQSVHTCVTLLERRAGPMPPGWLPTLANAEPLLKLTPMVLVLAADPALLGELAKNRSARRAIAATLAPGIAVVPPERAPTFARAAERQGVAVAGEPMAAVAPPTEFTPAERATLAALCAQSRRDGGEASAPPVVLEALERRLRAGLDPQLQTRVDAAPPPSPVSVADLAPEDRLAGLGPEARGEATLRLVQMALRQRRALKMRYQPRDATPNIRTVIPIRLEQHGDHWYLGAFCLLERAERTFRLDRVLGAVDIPLRATRPTARAIEPVSPQRYVRPTPRTVPIPPPQKAPPPLIRVWLE